MSRPSDNDTLTLPKNQRETIFANALLEQLDLKATLRRPLNAQKPDFEVVENDLLYGLELTQPDLHGGSGTALRRMFERISTASYRLFNSLDVYSPHITVEFQSSVSINDFDRNFSAENYAKLIGQLVAETANGYSTPPLRLDFYFRGSQARIVADKKNPKTREIDHFQLPLLHKTRAIYVISNNGAYEN